MIAADAQRLAQIELAIDGAPRTSVAGRDHERVADLAAAYRHANRVSIVRRFRGDRVAKVLPCAECGADTDVWDEPWALIQSLTAYAARKNFEPLHRYEVVLCDNCYPTWRLR